MSGLLVLLDDDGNEKQNFKPLNNSLRIGSDFKADVILSGLKNLAFQIDINGFGRVSITTFMKKLMVNEKRMPKKFSCPLRNNSMVQILNYKFCWKYNPKLTKSYSMSQCSKPNQNVENDFIGKRRKTVVCLNRDQFEDEGAAHKEPEALIEVENEENTTTVSTVNKPTDDFVSSSSRTPFKPIDKLQALSDPVMDDAKASDEYETPTKTIIDSEVQSTSKRRASLLLPVRENRAAELRRASIRKSMSVTEYPISFNSFTPKKPNPSVAMVKGINAIVRVGLDGDDAIGEKSPIKNRNVLDTTNLQKFIKTPNKSFPQIIDKMDMFHVVTDEMKKVGPSAYVSSVKKLGAVNSPRRTPKKCFSTPKRQSLYSELAEMGICPIPVEEPINKDGKEDIAPSANHLPLDEMEETLQVSSDESDDDDELKPEEFLLSSSDSSIISVDSDSECEIVSSEDEGNIADDTTEDNLVISSTSSSPHESSQSSGAPIQTISDSKTASQISSDQLDCKRETEDELKDSVFANGTETSVKLLTEDNALKLGIQRSEQFSDKSMFSTDEEATPIMKIRVNDDQPEQQTEIFDDKSSKNSEVNNDTEAVAVSTPLTRRPSLIRTRRNSRLCSLDECCNPNTPYGSPRKTKSEKKVQASPRSILKTPNASKTPKRNVRILEPILHEEDDEETKTSAENVSQIPNALDDTFEIDTDESAIESSFVVAEMQLSHSNKTPEKRQSFDDQSNSVLNKEIISSGVQDTNSHSNIGEDNGQKSVQQINSAEPSNAMIHSQIEKELQLDASVKLEEATEDIEHQDTKSHSNSANDEGDEFVVPVNLREPSNEDILLEVKQETHLKVSSGEIEADTFETRLSSPEPNDQETCQDKIISSEPDCDSIVNGTDFEEEFISPEPNKDIVSSSLYETNSHLNDGEENRKKSVELNNSLKPSKEISSSAIKETHQHCNDDDMDEKEQTAQQSNLSESSNEIILSGNEKEPQLHASTGFEERPNSSEINDHIERQINQSYSNSGTDKKEKFEESINSDEVLNLGITQERQLDEGELEELDEEKSVSLPELSNEAILLEINQEHILLVSSGETEREILEEQLTASAPYVNEESLTETCQQLRSETKEDGEPQSESNISVNGTDEEQSSSTEPNKEIISTDVKESHSHSNNGGKDEEKPSEERSNQPEPSTEIILSEIEHDPPLDASVELDKQLNLSEKNEDIENKGNESYYNSSKDVETEFEEQENSPDLSKVHLSELKREPQLGLNSGEIVVETFEKRLTSPEPNDEGEDVNSTETCQQIIIPSETKRDGEPQSDSNTSGNSAYEEQLISTESNKEIISTEVKEMNEHRDLQLNSNKDVKDNREPQSDSNISVDGANVDEETISPELIKEMISPGVEESDSHSNGYEENGEISVERTNSSEPSKEICSLVIEETHLHYNDGDKDEKGHPEERPLESSKEIIVSDIEQKSQLNMSVGLVERPKSSEPKKDIEHQNQSYSKSGKLDGEQSETLINLPLLSNEAVLSEKNQKTQSKVDICEEEESNEHNNSSMSSNDTHIPSLNEPSTEVKSYPTLSGQLKLDFEFKSRKTLLNKINSALGSYGFGSIEWSKKNAVDTSEDDTKPNVESRISETNDTALATVPTQDIPKSLTSIRNDSETRAVIEIQSQHNSESAATSNRETTTTKILKQPKSIEIEPEKFSESHANNIDESSNVPTRSGRKIESKIPEDTNQTKTDSKTVELGTPEEISRSTVNKTNVQRDLKRKVSKSEESDTDESHMARETPATSENDVRVPTRGRNNKAKSKTGDDSKNVEVGAVRKVSKATVNKANVQGSRTRKITAIEDSEANNSDTDDDVNIPTRGRNNKTNPKTGYDSKNVEVGAVGKVSRAIVNKANVQGSRTRKITAIEYSEENHSDTDDDVNIPTRGRNNKTNPKTGDDSTNVEVGAVEKVSRATVNKANVQGGSRRKITATKESEANQLDTDDVADIPTQGRNNKAKSNAGDDSKDLKLAAVERDSSARAKKIVQKGRKRKISETEDSEENQSDTDDAANIPTRGRNNKAKSKTGDGSKNVEVGAVRKVSRATVNKANVQGGRTRKIPVTKDSEANQSDTDDAANIPTRGRNNKAKSNDGDNSKDLKLAAVERDSSAPAKKIVQKGGKRKINEEGSEENQSDTDDVANIPTRGRNNKAKSKTGDGSKNVEVGAVRKVSRATVNKANVHGSRTRKITAIEDSEANNSDTDYDVNIPTRGRNNKTNPKTGDDSKNVEVGAVEKVSRATVNKANAQGGRRRKITATKDSEANQLDTDDVANIPTRGRNNKAKSNAGDDSKDLKLSAAERDSSAPAKKIVQKGGKRKINETEDSEANQSDTDDDVNIPTRSRNNKTYPKTGDDSKNVEVGAVRKVSKAIVNKANVQGDRKRKFTATEDSEANQSDTDDVVNIPTRGRNNKAKSNAGDDSKDLKLAAVERDSSAAAKKIVQKGGKRKINKTEGSEANQSYTVEMTSEVSAPNNNEKRITTRSGNNKAKADDDSKTVELGAVENVRKGRSRQATVAKNLEAPASATDESQSVSEIPATSEDDKHIQKRKGGENKADASGDSKPSNSDAVESVSEIPTLKKATRGLKRKMNANDNTEATTSVKDTKVSEASSSTKVNQIKVPSLNQQSTTDDLKKINEKTKPESSNATTSQPSNAVTRKGRKLAEVDSEADTLALKDSQLSKPVTRKGRK